MSALDNINGGQFGGKRYPDQLNQEAKWPDYDPATTRMKTVGAPTETPKAKTKGKHESVVEKPVYSSNFSGPKHGDNGPEGHSRTW